MIFVLLINKQVAVIRQVVPLRYNGDENRLNIIMFWRRNSIEDSKNYADCLKCFRYVGQSNGLVFWPICVLASCF